ncbi:MAG: phage tail protein [Duncaniella sp.]|nr:phage tail protein [Duncaniella sp.]
MATTTKTGYCNGSDILLYVNDKPIGHCTTHTSTFNSETKDIAVKPVASKKISSGLWKGKTVVGLSISISTEGLRFYNETETGFKGLFKEWIKGKSVKLKCLERESSETPYLVGQFVITSLEESAPAQDNATYSANFENDGEPETLDDSAITENDESLSDHE